MRFLHRIVAGLRILFNRSASDRELEDEVSHFFAEAEAELVAGGASTEEARRRVRVRFGDALTSREDVRSYGWESAVESLWIDVRIAARRLRKSPGFTAVAVLTLALGIGSAAAIFSVVRPVLLDPLPYPEAERIVSVMDRAPDGSPLQVTFGTYLELAARTRVFDALAVSRPWQPIATDGDRPERVEGLSVSAEHFDVLGVPPVVGPGFDAAEDRPGGAALVILSHGLWHRMYGADPAIVGADVRLDDRTYAVVGIMPPGFQDATAPLAQMWTLLQYNPAPPSFDTREWGHHLNLIARLARATNTDGVLEALEEVASRPRPDFARPAWAAMGQDFVVRPLREATTADVRPTMLALVGAVALLLAIACANVTVLLLAWGARREGELAMRVALGAGRGRVARQLLAESLVLAVTGGALAVAVTRLGSSALATLVPAGLQAPGGTSVDGGTFLFALVATTVVGVAVGLAPALTLSRGNLGWQMRTVGRGGHRSARRALVVTEVALALVLLVGTGLLMRSVQQLFAIPVGLDSDGLVVMQVHTIGLGDYAETHRFFDQVLNAVRNEPGVSAATLTAQLPLSGDLSVYGVTYEDADDIAGAANVYVVEPSYFEAVGIPIVQGRDLSETDLAGAPPVVVVSESLASRAFGHRDPLGRRMHIGRTDLPWFTVVGVVGDVKQASLGSADTDAVYLTSEQWHVADDVRWIAARAEGAPAQVVDGLRRAVWSVDPNQAILRVEMMDDLVASSESRRRFVLTVLETFAVLALVLAAIGLYGVLSRSVAERMPELAVRAALGASRQGIVALVVRQGLALTIVGIVVGVLAAALASRTLTTLLFGVSPLDPIIYLATAAVLGVVALFACAVPAVRAGRADPMETLRAE